MLYRHHKIKEINDNFAKMAAMKHDIQKYQKHYSESGLLAKIGKVCRRAGIKAIYLVLLLYYVLKDKKTPFDQKAIILGALGYFIFPADMIPDLIPLLGFTDDIAAMLACVRTVKANLTPEIRQKAVQKLSDWFTDVEYEKLEETDKDIDEK
jgi:uncharacterized membrane protein YkvA (DUF1232 family)